MPRTTNPHGYRVGESCSCKEQTCRIMMFPAQVRITRNNPVTREVTTPLVSVEILMGTSCGTRYGRAF